MKILIIILILIFYYQESSSSSCLPCSSSLCYQCYNTIPNDRINIETLSIQCNTTNNLFQQEERFYSIIQSYTIRNCTMKILYIDQYTLWNYLEHVSITYANLTRLSPIIFNRSLSISPILYSIKTLNLSYNSIRSLTKNFSYYFPSLEKLDLSYNQLNYIKKRTFYNLIYLKELYLNNNYLKQIFSNIFPSQSLYLINLNNNSWHCTCTNILTLAVSRPIPICSSPNYFQNQNVSDVARQCFLRTKANILITTNIHKNLTCILSSIIEQWKNKILQNVTLISAWHIEQRRSILFEPNKYLICFNFNSTHPESIDVILNFPLMNSITTTTMNMSIRTIKKLPRLFLWILNISKHILPKFLQKSDKYVLIIWLILLVIACSILIYLIYLIYHKKTNTNLHSLIHLDQNLSNHQNLFSCKNPKCFCQYCRRRHDHAKFYLTQTNSSEQQSLYIQRQSSFIEPNQLRYARIKRISSTKNYLTGEFRTIVKLKSLPN